MSLHEGVIPSFKDLDRDILVAALGERSPHVASSNARWRRDIEITKDAENRTRHGFERW